MTRILLLYYSQSGDAARVAGSLAESLKDPDVELVVERLRPVIDYPNPWKSVGNFFNVLPECHLGPLPALEPVGCDLSRKFDLVILVYQVWFLAPSLPIQSFLKGDAAKFLKDTKVMTVSVSRNMWQSASETMKKMLQELGALHNDNVALTHQGPAWATFVTTPRALLYGKKEGFWGVFPPAGLSEEELAKVGRFGQAILNRRDQLKQPEVRPLLTGLGAVSVNRRYLLPDLLGWSFFRVCARGLQFLGRWGKGLRRAGIYLFVVLLVCAILIGIPITMILRLLLYPLFRLWTDPYVKRLEQPSDP